MENEELITQKDSPGMGECMNFEKELYPNSEPSDVELAQDAEFFIVQGSILMFNNPQELAYSTGIDISIFENPYVDKGAFSEQLYRRVMGFRVLTHYIVDNMEIVVFKPDIANLWMKEEIEYGIRTGIYPLQKPEVIWVSDMMGSLQNNEELNMERKEELLNILKSRINDINEYKDIFPMIFKWYIEDVLNYLPNINSKIEHIKKILDINMLKRYSKVNNIDNRLLNILKNIYPESVKYDDGGFEVLDNNNEDININRMTLLNSLLI